MTIGGVFLAAHFAIIALFFIVVGLGLVYAAKVLNLPPLIRHSPTHSNSSLHWWRRGSQVGFFLLFASIPLLSILRLDVASHQLIVLGHPWSLGLSEDLFSHATPREAIALAGAVLLKLILPLVILLSIFPILGFATGRLFCGWICPEGTLFELADFFTQKIMGRRTWFTHAKSALDLPRPSWSSRVIFSILGLLTFAAIGVIGGLVLAAFFVDPATLFDQVGRGEFSRPLAVGVLGVVLFVFVTSVIVRHGVCKYVCAAGMMQVLFSWFSPVAMRLQFDRERGSVCTNCRECEKVCFMNLNPRNLKRELSCLNCGECIAACRKELEPQGIATLLTFTYSGEKKSCAAANPRSLPVQGSRQTRSAALFAQARDVR